MHHATGVCMYLAVQNMKENDNQSVGRSKRGSAIVTCADNS